MSKFKVGDVCEILRDSAVTKGVSGLQCSILELPRFRRIIGGHRCFGYLVDAANGAQYAVAEENLRLKRPPSWNRWIYDTSGLTSEDKHILGLLAAGHIPASEMDR